MKDVSFNMRVPAEYRQRVEQAAKEAGMSVSQFVRNVLDLHLGISRDKLKDDLANLEHVLETIRLAGELFKNSDLLLKELGEADHGANREE